MTGTERVREWLQPLKRIMAPFNPDNWLPYVPGGQVLLDAKRRWHEYQERKRLEREAEEGRDE